MTDTSPANNEKNVILPLDGGGLKWSDHTTYAPPHPHPLPPGERVGGEVIFKVMLMCQCNSLSKMCQELNFLSCAIIDMERGSLYPG
jgi:hypothetical protein